MHVLIVTPIFPPATGGAATYYSLLSRGLLDKGLVSKVTVVTERMKGMPACELRDSGRLEIIRLFPSRAGRHLNKFLQYLLYGIQNLSYLLIPIIVRGKKPDLIVVHSSFHNYFNFLTPVIRYLSKYYVMVADVRDHQLPAARLSQLEHYHALIVCSLNVKAHLYKRESLRSRITHIPVLQEPIRLPGVGSDTLEKFRLAGVNYLLYAGLIKQEKGVGLLLKAYELYRSLGGGEELVLAGTVKDRDLLRSAMAIPGVRHIGSVSRAQLLELIASSRMVINLSASEGMPRICLEALALGVKVALPPNIPEFERHCPDCVVSSQVPERVAHDVKRILEAPVKSGYPISDHDLDRVCEMYALLFRELCRTRGVRG